MQSHDAEYRESGEGWARTPLSDTRLTEMAARAAAATAGPWRATEATDACVSLIHTDDGQATLLGRVAADADAEFIAHAREDLPALLAEVDRLRAELEERRVELRARRTEDLNLRGLLAPDGLPRRVPMELGASLVPAVDRLLLELDRFRDGHRNLFALMQDGQHWNGQRLVSEALLSQRDVRRALHWPPPVAPDGPCECKATADGEPVHPTTAKES